MIILIVNKIYEPLAWTYRSLFVFLWFIILAFTMIQPARLNSKCNKFKQIALSAKVYGYHNCTRDELDSFLLFISNANLRVYFNQNLNYFILTKLNFLFFQIGQAIWFNLETFVYTCDSHILVIHNDHSLSDFNFIHA